jgi:hypothetical protein
MTEKKINERGPAGFPSLDSANGLPEVSEQEQQFDPNILKCVIPRQYKTAPFADSLLALEIIDGPYKGVVFGFSAFTLLPQKLEDNLVPARFETTVFSHPKGFEKDEAFDFFCRELLLAWLHFIAVNDIGGMIRTEPITGIH